MTAVTPECDMHPISQQRSRRGQMRVEGSVNGSLIETQQIAFCGSALNQNTWANQNEYNRHKIKIATFLAQSPN